MGKTFILIFFLLFSISGSFAQDWPKIMPAEAEVGFDINMSRFDFKIPIYSSRGKQLYWLICKAGHEDDPDDYGDFEYGSGQLSCRLGLHQKGFNNFLAEDDRAVWYTRGLIELNQLIGQCGKYPEYGRVRHFRLRGFKLTLEIKNLVFEEGHLKYFIIKISVEPDPTALTAQSEQTGYLDPGTRCEKNLKGNKPRYCRDPDTLSWRKCEELQ